MVEVTGKSSTVGMRLRCCWYTNIAAQKTKNFKFVYILCNVAIKYLLNTMTQITLSLDILSQFLLLYENETSSHGPKNCRKIGVYDKKTWNCWKKTGV